MPKLTLNPSPTFKLKVGIPVPGAGTADVEFTFKHRTVDELAAWVEANTAEVTAAMITDMAVAWDLDDEFNAENAMRLCQAYGGAEYAIFSAYLRELRGVRAKN